MSRGGNIVMFPERNLVEEEAALWVSRMDRGPLSPEDRAKFDAWRAASPAHGEAIARLKTHWNQLDGLAHLAATRTARPRRAAVIGTLGALAAAAAAAFVVFSGLPDRPAETAPVIATAPTPALVGVYQTAVGEQSRIELADGSILTLNTNSQIEVRMTPAERSVRLLEGEAFFEVAHDAARPFRVYAGNGVTSAIGTAFSVRLEGEQVRVLVSEGKVSFAEIADVAKEAEPVAYLAAGESGVFSDRVKTIEAVEADVVSRKLSWRGGRLEFAGEPLSSVVEDISRYTGIEIEIASEELARIRVGGSYEVGEVDAMLEQLETSFGLDVERLDDTHVRITRADP
jgi:transmembrane sensor